MSCTTLNKLKKKKAVMRMIINEVILCNSLPTSHMMGDSPSPTDCCEVKHKLDGKNLRNTWLVCTATPLYS